MVTWANRAKNAFNEKTILIVSEHSADRSIWAEKLRQALDKEMPGNSFRAVVCDSYREAMSLYLTMTLTYGKSPAAIVMDDFSSSAGMDSYKLLGEVRANENAPSSILSEEVIIADYTPVYVISRDAEQGQAQGNILTREANYNIVQNEEMLNNTLKQIAGHLQGRDKINLRGGGKSPGR